MSVNRHLRAIALVFLLCTGIARAQDADLEGRPSFLVVVADDMGWSDIGALGGEIRTPNIDALAAAGTLMTDYYVAPTCAPTRAMLVTGVDSHEAGLGVQSGVRAANQVGINYEGELHDGVVTVAEALQAQGYQTFMSGKWHLANDEAQRPTRRGFQRAFSLMTGGASHFADQKEIGPFDIPVYVESGEQVEALPQDWYSSIGYADKLLEYLDERDENAPFLAYLAFTAPHDPLQVPDDWLDRYRGAYDAGPQATRGARAKRLEALGLIPEGTRLWQYPRFPGWFPNHAAPWDERSAEQREKDARPMEIYAAMVELMDQQIGRVLEFLREQGELDNTYVVFFSDNGASAAGPLVYPGVTPEWYEDTWDISHENRGRPGNFTVMGREWASAAGTPWKLYKASVSEGGIRSPLIVSGPSVPAGERSGALAHVTDVAPTIYELAGVEPQQLALFDGKILPQGRSLIPVLTGESPAARSSFGVHLFGNRGFRQGNWKISNTLPPLSTGEWELFDLGADPGAVNDLAAERPERLAELLAGFDEYMQRHDVILPDESPLNVTLRHLYPDECDWWCEVRFTVIGWLN